MTKEEIRAKYSRIPTDFSQIQMLKDQLLASGMLDVAQVNPENAGKAIVFDETGALVVGDAIPSGGSVSIAGTSLVIPESTEPGPEPVITIDGVPYFHEAHKAYSELSWHYFEMSNIYRAILRLADLADLTEDEGLVIQYHSSQNEPAFADVSDVALRCGGGNLYPAPNDYSHIVYKEQLLEGIEVLDTYYMVGSNTEVKSYENAYPSNVAKIYVKLNDDGSLDVYYNLKNDGAPEKIDSVKQGNAVIPLAVPSGEAASGTVLTADGQGGAAFAALPQGGGTQLYLHTITNGNATLSLITLSSTALTFTYAGSYYINGVDADSFVNMAISNYFTNNNNNSVFYKVVSCGGGGGSPMSVNVIMGNSFASFDFATDVEWQTLTDTVAPL